VDLIRIRIGHMWISFAIRVGEKSDNAYIECLKGKNIRISMSRRGNPYDNAFAESFIKTLKYEEVYLSDYRTFNEAYDNIENFIESI
jgi:putative transposase